MKIALFVHCFFPDHFYGTETYTLGVAQNLKKMGHEPVVVSAVFQGEPKNEKMVFSYEYEGIPVHCIDKNYIPNIRIKDTYYQPEMRSLLRDLLLQLKPDIVHVTHLINHTAVLLEVAAELKIPTVATLTDFFGFCFTNKLEAADGALCGGPSRQRTNCLACFLKARTEYSDASFVERFAHKDLLIFPLAFLLNFLTKLPGVRRGEIALGVLDITRRPDILAEAYKNYLAVIAPTSFLKKAYLANGLNVQFHDIKFGVDSPRQPKPDRPAGMPLKFGFIGQIAGHKGTDILVQAFCQLPKGSAELHIFGPEDQDPLYTAGLKKIAADADVFFRGTFPKEKIGAVFSELDFLVIPSTWYENSPLILLNSLASHTPVIVSDVEGMTEFVKEGINGYTFARGSVDHLARILKMIVADLEKARQLTLTTEYPRTSEMMTEDVVSVYEAVLAN